MNKDLIVRKKRGGGKRRGKGRSPHSRWIAFLKKTYAIFERDTANGRQFMIMYRDQVPPRMPIPGGPSRGAELTTVQLINSFTISAGISTGSIVQNAATALFGKIAFSLQDLGQESSFSALFDQYRVEEVQLRIRGVNNALSTYVNSSTTERVPYLLIVVDRDDSTTPSQLTDLQEYDNCHQVEAYESIDIVLQPSVAPAIFSVGAFSGYSIDRADQHWIDMANAAVPFYGVKFGVNALDVSTTATWKWEVCAWMKVSFKNIR